MRTPDIVSCLAGLRDTQNREVNFEIVWIDDTTFLVAASVRGQIAVGEELETILRDHGPIIHAALCERFSNGESIVLLESHLQMLADGRSKNARAPNDTNWFSRALTYLGLRSNKRENGDDGVELSNKRQRIS